MFIFKRLPQAKAWGYLLPPLRGEIITRVVPLKFVAIPNFFNTSRQATLWQVELKSTPMGINPVAKLKTGLAEAITKQHTATVQRVARGHTDTIANYCNHRRYVPSIVPPPK